MQPDDELCLCFHVSWRKVINYVRVEKVTRPSQVSQCFGAGTGCGWCRPFLNRLVQQVNESPPHPSEIPAWLENRSPRKDRYQAGRESHKNQGKLGANSELEPPKNDNTP